MPQEIITRCVCPPIPVRDHDWTAYVEGREEWLQGYGSTEQEAIDDLMQKIEEV